MKTRMSNLFNLSVLDTNYFSDNQDKIELVSSISLSRKCEKHLSMVNESFHESDFFRRDKDFNRAIEVLKKAYIATFDLTGSDDLKFGEFFRSTIIESVESIHFELRHLSMGLIKRKRFQSSYQMTGNVLNELKELVKNPKPYIKKNDVKHFIENYQKRNVS